MTGSGIAGAERRFPALGFRRREFRPGEIHGDVKTASYPRYRGSSHIEMNDD